MTRLMIVDDEEEIRKGIRNIIDWEAYGIVVCGEAENGSEALRLADELAPDIILIDIRMPVMNGLQVIETLKENKKEIRSIILSGYDDFSYAQKALKFGASDYLLKPCRPEDILETVLKVKTLIESERNKKETFNRFKSQFNKNLPVIKEKYLAKLITAKKRNRDKLLESFELYSIKLKETGIAVIVLRIDNVHAFSEKYSSEDSELMKFAIKNIAEEVISTEFYCEVFEHSDDIIIIINLENGQYNIKILSLLEQTKENIKKYLGFTVSAGLGKVYEDITNICISYNEALQSVEAGFQLGTDRIINYDDINCGVMDGICYPINEEKEILNCIKSGSSEELDTRFEDFFTALNPTVLTKDYLLKSGLALALSIYHLCIEKNINVDEIFSQSFSYLDSILKLDTLSQLKERLLELAKAAQDKINSKKTGNKTIEHAIKYIEENYNRDLNLETVAGIVFITSGYLSLLFRQVMGVNFVDFLHKTRVEKACEFLKDLHLKTYEVAFKVGYNDEKYFSQIFKKHMGITPSQYRDSLR